MTLIIISISSWRDLTSYHHHWSSCRCSSFMTLLSMLSCIILWRCSSYHHDVDHHIIMTLTLIIILAWRRSYHHDADQHIIISFNITSHVHEPADYLLIFIVPSWLLSYFIKWINKWWRHFHLTWKINAARAAFILFLSYGPPQYMGRAVHACAQLHAQGRRGMHMNYVNCNVNTTLTDATAHMHGIATETQKPHQWYVLISQWNFRARGFSWF